MAAAFFAALSVAVFSVPCDADDFGKRVNFLKLGGIGENVAKAHLEEALADLEHDSLQGRLGTIEKALKPMYASLPKNTEGTLEHLAVRYALHRFFNNRSGWFIRGLEPNSAPLNARGADELEWIPAFLQEQLEQRLGGKGGATLEQLAALAAALEDLVRDEAVGRLDGVYEVRGLDKNVLLTEQELSEALETYYISFLVAGNFSTASLHEVKQYTAVFREKYTGWAQAEEWFETSLAKSLPKATRARGANFEQMLRSVDLIGRTYYEFNDIECNDLKQTLRGMEGRKPGRVRLAAFYNRGLYSHWRFTEKVDYLRSLGALDESDPQRPYVIIANYAMARPNCLDSSKLYAICCRNDCESLMGGLEAQIGAATASPERVAELVAHLPSAFSQAPKNISAAQMARLGDVARLNGGTVPLHGRLFAQFMHHVFPLECPYPHEKGTINPQTPDEWLRQTGHTEESESTEEMLKHVERDNCAVSFKGKMECEGETDELPWTSTEELLTSRRFRDGDGGDGEGESAIALHAEQTPDVDQVGVRHRRTSVAVVLLFLGVAAAAAVALYQKSRGCGRLVPHLKEDDDTAEPSGSVFGALSARIAWRPLVAVLALTLLAVALDLVNGLVVLCGALLSALAVLMAGGLSKRAASPRAKWEA